MKQLPREHETELGTLRATVLRAGLKSSRVVWNLRCGCGAWLPLTDPQMRGEAAPICPTPQCWPARANYDEALNAALDAERARPVAA